MLRHSVARTQRATLDIVGRAYGRVLTHKQVAEEMGAGSHR